MTRPLFPLDPAKLVVPDTGEHAHAIHVVDVEGYPAWLAGQPERVRAALEGRRFRPAGYENAILPGDKPDAWSVVTIVADAKALSHWCLARLAEVLPAGRYRLANGEIGPALLGWMLGQYRFDRYRSEATPPAGARILLTAEPGRIADAAAEAEATMLVRDLVNTPANDMGPAELQHIAERLAKQHGGEVQVVRGDALAQQFPLVQAVGAAAEKHRAPRVVELLWGREGDPRIALVGKGVCFDSGGLNIKPGAGMGLMKKDMGGAAHVLGLAHIIMARRLPVRLHVIVAAVENAIAGAAMRPGDIVTSRQGLTVEVTNTDAEGRLILADSLARAAEEKPAMIVDFATLTGAARVALGPDLPPVFANEDALGPALVAAGKEADDPLWQLPLWDGYDEMLKSDIADLDNSPANGFAGAITAALFLRRFVPSEIAWAHLDTFAWRPAAKPGRPKGGDALGMRAVWRHLKRLHAAPARVESAGSDG